MLYLITNRKLVKNLDFFQVIEKAIDGGVDVIILREKDLNNEQLESIAIRIKEIISSRFSNINNSQIVNKNKYNKTKLIINSNREVAEKINADGYHMTFKNFINRKKDYDGLLGVSVHTVEEAILAEVNGADYVLASHIFNTDCKKGLPPKGTMLIRNIKDNVGIPVIALGGINDKNIHMVIENGADGVAVMSYIMASSRPCDSAKLLALAMNVRCNL